jgi:hypothetical protein
VRSALESGSGFSVVTAGHEPDYVDVCPGELELTR